MIVTCTVDRCEPVPRVVNALSDSKLAVKDSVVRYTCFEGFVALDSSAMSTLCDGTNWTPALSQCEGTYHHVSVFALIGYQSLPQSFTSGLKPIVPQIFSSIFRQSTHDCLLRPQPTRRTSWKLVSNLLQAWSFSTFHFCSKLIRYDTIRYDRRD